MEIKINDSVIKEVVKLRASKGAVPLDKLPDYKEIIAVWVNEILHYGLRLLTPKNK